MTYSPITPEVKDKLISLLGRENVITDTEKMQPYAHDEVTDPAYHHLPEVVVTPETTEQTAAVVRLANQYRFPVVPPWSRYRSCLRSRPPFTAAWSYRWKR